MRYITHAVTAAATQHILHQIILNISMRRSNEYRVLQASTSCHLV